ncbi:immunity 49 family protein [Kitasatospora sp. NPDC088134]|uniref:immunity 49 family protein n=1 Tax=Kitasatospora sp. NPDC088134 TaxID=3364071 RepID=UPI003826510C
MTVRIARHEVRGEQSERSLELLEATVAELVAGMPDSEDDRAEALDYALGSAKRRCLLDPDGGTNPTWHAGVLPVQIGAALFESATAESGPVRCRVGTNGEVLELPATGPQEYLDPVLWLNTFSLAVVCREEQRIPQLLGVPVEFLRASGAEIDEYVYRWIEALQLAWERRPERWDALVAAIEGTAPERIRVASKEVMLKLLHPPLELFQLYLRRETAEFNKSLATALTWHREYWTGNEARALRSEGLVALAPLAMACLAFDAGMPIEVEPPYLPIYLPIYLLKGAWVGEFPTR